MEDISSDDLVQVMWDNGNTFRYRMGSDDGYELNLAPSELKKEKETKSELGTSNIL